MRTLTVELVSDKAIDLLRDLKALKIIRFLDPNQSASLGVRLGSLEGEHSIPDDFNEPLDALKDCQ